MVWYIRTIPPELITDSCLQFDNSVIQEFEFLIGHGQPVFHPTAFLKLNLEQNLVV